MRSNLICNAGLLDGTRCSEGCNDHSDIRNGGCDGSESSFERGRHICGHEQFLQSMGAAASGHASSRPFEPVDGPLLCVVAIESSG